MELRHLRYFVAVAGKENISQAAKSLHVSQPALSRQMRDLESELGVSLFKRGGKSVHLTEAGRVFLSESRAALNRIEDAISVTKAVADRRRNRICAGYGPIPTAEILPLALGAFQLRNPKAKVDLRAMTTQEMIRALRKGEIDVSLMADGLSEDLEGLTIAEICSYPLCVAISKKHRFAQRRVVLIEELAKEPIISLSRRGFRWYNALVERVLSPYNRNLKIVEEFDDSLSVIAAVEAGRGVAIAWSVVARTAGSRLAFRPLRPDPQPLPIVLAYREVATTPLLEEFVSAVKSVQVDSPSS
jgi:DNA-binding transcriptional LysR family regulator